MSRKRQASLPDTAHLVSSNLGIVVRVAIAEVHVPRIRATVLRRRPKVVGRLAQILLPTCRSYIQQI
ncbi:MAG: hypothetical protein WCQ49_02955 [Candidatus Saccharibacteria bacterium]